MCSVVIPNPLYTMYLVFGTDIYIAAYSRYHGIETMLSSETAHSTLDVYLLPRAEQDYIILDTILTTAKSDKYLQLHVLKI